MYAIAEVSDNDKEVDKPKKTGPKNLAPVMIMVVDTIFSVRSRTPLRALLDSGSTTTLTNKRCLPRNCKPREIASSRKVNTLAGTYTSTEVVIMRSLRLPEFNKNRNVNQQKALVFQSETCKYNAILGADFLTKQALMSNTAQEPWNGSTISYQCATLTFFKTRSLKQLLK